MFLGADPVTGGHGYDLLSRSLPKEESKRIMFRPMSSAVLNMKKYFPALLCGGQHKAATFRTAFEKFKSRHFLVVPDVGY